MIRPVSRPDNLNTDSLLTQNVWSSNTLTFSFPMLDHYTGYDDLPEGEANPLDGFAPFGTQQKDAVRDIFASISSFTSLTFVEVSGDAAGEAKLRFGSTDETDAAYAYFPGWHELGGDSWFGNLDQLTAPHIGNYAYHTLLHEIGHTLGLEHPHDPGFADPMPADRDWMAYTVMSYRSQADAQFGYTNETNGFAQSFMLEDIAALQHAYGANYAARFGDTTYTFRQDSAEVVIDGIGQGDPLSNIRFTTIWDGGGADTYDFSNYTRGGTINIQPGEWTHFDTYQSADLARNAFAPGSIANAYLFDGNPASLIENVIAGSGDDVILGNQANNRLNGGAGDDELYGGDGKDWLLGGLGRDSLTGGTQSDYFVFDAMQSNSSDIVLDYAAQDFVIFGHAETAVAFSVSGTDVLVNSIKLAGAASANVSVILQSSAAIFTASSAQIQTVLTDSPGALAAIGGAYQLTMFDANTDEGWTTSSDLYDAAGLLDLRTIINDDQTRVAIDFDQSNTNGWIKIADSYDAANRHTNKVTQLDNGALLSTVFDVGGTRAWSQSTAAKDASSRNDFLDVTYDNGQRIFTDYDQGETQPWITALTFFDEGNQRTARRVNFDDGHAEVTYEDYAGTEAWTRKIDAYATDGKRDYVNEYNDDGTRKTTDFDQNADQNWSLREVLYNAAGQSQTLNTIYDDGTRILKAFDPGNTNATQEVIVGYDVGGLADFITTLYDDNSRISRDYDQNDEHDWSQEVWIYDTSGELSDNYFIY